MLICVCVCVCVLVSGVYTSMCTCIVSFLLEYVACRREKHDIPLLVQTCVDEVERRGMDETGIYRVAGVISDVEGLRKAFDSGIVPGILLFSHTPICCRLFASSTIMC